MDRIRIETDESPIVKRVYVNDIEISNCVTEVTIHMGVGVIDTVTLSLIGNVELPEEIQAALIVKKEIDVTPPGSAERRTVNG